MIRRRDALEGLLLATLGALVNGGCSGANVTSEKPKPPPIPPTEVGALDALLVSPGLQYAIFTKPRDIASTAFLIPSIARVVSEESFDRYAATSGLDLRQLKEAVVARYETDDGPADVYVVRHTADPKVLTARFRERITSQLTVSRDRPDLTRVQGHLGTQPAAFARFGQEVVAFQFGGDLRAGPARIAGLRAQGELTKVPGILEDQALRALHKRFGSAPAIALARGPFEPPWNSAARGLAGTATAVGAAARPSVREGLLVSVAFAGDYSQTGDAASETLLAAWEDLAASSFGELLGLNEPREKPLRTHAPDAIAVTVELDPDAVSRGLAAATTDDVETMMAW